MNDNEKMYHIDLSVQDIEGAKIAIIPGDPGRVPKIAKHLENARQLAFNREYNSYLGELCGQKVLVVSTGIGGPSAAICVEELAMIGVESFIRVGTCGGINTKVEAGDVVVVNGSIRFEGTSKEYMPIEFPAVSDFAITTALNQAAQNLGYKHHVGIVQCKDSFYGQHAPERMPTEPELLYKWNAWIKGGTLASEMESAALFVVAATLGVKAGAVMHCVWNQEREKLGLGNKEDHDTEKAILVTIEAVRLLLTDKQS